MRLRSRYADIRAVVAVFLVGLAMSWPAGGPAEETPPLAAKPTDTNPPEFLRQRPSRLANHLAGEASPYLQLHVHNPVDWYPWGEEALTRARVESKPIFLSVGYSTCYWCHVMERKVFSNPEIAALMNKYFINIKVDREERPDLDEIYMKAAHLLTGTGGWPNSVFLTPETKPFFAGSYFPPTDNYGRPGFPKVLRAISSLWVEDRDRVLTIASEVSRALAKRSEIQPTGNDLPQPDVLLEAARVQLSAAYESQHGGFSSRTKFARPSTLDVLLVSYERTHDANTLAMVTKTLDEMALGGVHDHLAGGFHRYSTEPTWSIPHFEKMLYDNAQLIGVYARAYRMTQRPLYRQVVQDIVDYLEREMMHPDGGFYSAQDAEVDSQEGASYVWSRDEIGAVLGPGKASAFLSFYELVSVREPPGKGVLRIKLAASAALGCDGRPDLAERIERFAPHRAQLLAARNQRDQPFRDEKVLAGWNGLAIRDLVAAAEILNQPEYIRTAERAAHFVLGRLGTPQGGLHRSYVAGQAREEGVLNDYAFLADGLLALHRATSDPRWLERAASLVDTMLDRFEDPERGGFYFSVDDPSLLLRPKTFEDSVLPSGNAVALHVLRLLANLSDRSRYQQAATRAARLLAIPLDQTPSAMGTAIVTLASTEPSQRPILASAEGGEPASGLRSPPRLPRSEDHVAVYLERDPKRPLDIIVRLVIDDGWHVNANPASLPFLIPTRIELDDALKPTPVHYPPGKAFHPAFSEETLSVYEGSIAITTTLGESPQRASPPVVVRYQACDHARCLPPAVSHLRLVESPQ